MKKLIFFLILCSSFSVNAQTNVYHPFPDSNAVWRESNITSGYMWTKYHEYQYYINGDTSFNSVVYHKVYKTDSINLWEPLPNNIQYYLNVLQFFIREDTNKRIWSYNPAGLDYLLYDFNMNVGDTLKTDLHYGHIISGIDSILIGSTYRKKFLIKSIWADTNYRPFIIEGIGTNHGLDSYFFAKTLHIQSLRCFTQNGIVLYTDSVLSNCKMVCNKPDIEMKKPKVQLYPNPFQYSSTFEVEGASFRNSVLKIYNILGTELKQYLITDSKTTIERNAMSNGIYYYLLFNKKGESVSGKFIIN